MLPALMVVGMGMGVCVAPVTVVAMSAAGSENVGVASAINNMVARTGGLLAIALFGLVLAERFNAALDHSLASLALSPDVIAALAPERAKLAGAMLPASLAAGERAAVESAIFAAFVLGYRWVMLLAGLLAFTSTVVALRWLGSTRAKRTSRA